MKKINENYFNISSDRKQNMESYLLEGEKILWKGRPKKMAYVLGKTLMLMPIAIFWALFDFGIIYMIVKDSGMGAIILMLIPFFSIHLMPVWLWLGSLIKSSREVKDLEYVISNKRILIFKGTTSIYIKESMNISELVDASLKVGIIDRMLRVGDITLYGESSKVIQITDIANANFLHNKFLGLCKNSNEDDMHEFYDDKFECPYCGTIFDAKEKKCPSCGSSKRSMM